VDGVVRCGGAPAPGLSAQANLLLDGAGPDGAQHPYGARGDQLGARARGVLSPPLDKRLLRLFQISALKPKRLTVLWVRWCRGAFPLLMVGRYLVALADGLKVPKEGRKMPAV
jgi:hypothetical protein